MTSGRRARQRRHASATPKLDELDRLGIAMKNAVDALDRVVQLQGTPQVKDKMDDLIEAWDRFAMFFTRP